MVRDGRDRDYRNQGVRIHRTHGRRRMLRAAGLVRLLALLVITTCMVASALVVGGALAGKSRGGAQAGASGASAPESVVQVYFTTGEQLAPVARSVDSSGDRVAAAVRALLAGPTVSERRDALDTAIPSGSRLRSVSLDDATASIVLNARFAAAVSQGVRAAGGKADYSARLAQVTFTVTALPGIRRVEVSAPGEKTVVLSRSDFLSPGSPPAPTPTLSASRAITGPGLIASGPGSQAGATPSSSPSASPVTPSPTPTTSASASPAGMGAIHAKDARQVQEALVRLKYLPPGAANGVFDYRTSQAVMAFQSWEGLQRDGIVGKQTASKLATAQQAVPGRRGSGRWVEIHRAKGTLLLVQDGVVVQAVHCSTGRTMDAPPYDTPAGSYKVFAKMIKSWSVPYKVWMPYAAYFDGGIAIHGLDYVPAYPASHGCVRVSMPEAPTVYAFVSVGTPVYVY
jgi:peptidoglycan hydrolase-like protein with peptidoglycan-binding domain